MTTHQDYYTYILDSLRTVNPYSETATNHTYSLGYLAAHLASLMERDPYVYREFKTVIDIRRKYIGPAAKK